jgi:hypothetical protein
MYRRKLKSIAPFPGNTVVNAQPPRIPIRFQASGRNAGKIAMDSQKDPQTPIIVVCGLPIATAKSVPVP